MKMLLFLFGSLMLCSCGPDKYPISFHMETGATDSKKFAFERDGHYYSKAPFISHKDIESYYSFPAPDNTYGIVVNVRKGLGSRVEGITASNLGPATSTNSLNVMGVGVITNSPPPVPLRS